MSGIKLKLTRQVIKQENGTYIQEKKMYSIEADPKMLKLADKNFKVAIVKMPKA